VPAADCSTRFEGQRNLRVGTLLTPQDDESLGEPYIEELETFDNRMAGGAKRNHQRGLRDAGDAMMDDDPLSEAVEAVQRLPRRTVTLNYKILRESSSLACVRSPESASNEVERVA
jgi:hypothetical protein